MQDEINNFIEKNASLIYKYINDELLKDIAVMNPNYFVKLIEEIFIKKNDIKIDNLNMIPYLIFTLFSNKGKIDYTSLRPETIDFKQINKESSTYYNYAYFSLDNQFLNIELMQSKFGGMAIDKDIIKFSKKIKIMHEGLDIFINENQNLLETNQTCQKIKKEIANLFK